MTSKPENLDFDPAYRGHGPLGPAEKPPWSIGGPQPDLAALVDQEMVHGEVLDAGCGEAALSLYLAEAGHRVVGLDLSATAIDIAKSSAERLSLTNASFAVADISSFTGYDNRFGTIIDSTLFHSLPIALREPYLASVSRAASPGASFFVLTFDAATFDRAVYPDVPEMPMNPVTAGELREAVSKFWEVDDIKPARIHANFPDSDMALPFDFEDEPSGLKSAPAWLLFAHLV